MKKAFLFAVLALLLILPVAVLQGQAVYKDLRTSTSGTLVSTSGSGTWTFERAINGSPSALVPWAFTITSKDDGTYSGTTPVIDGTIMRWSINPANGADAPTDNYDLTVQDHDTNDLMDTKGTNLDEAVSTTFESFVGDGTTKNMPFTIHGPLTITGSGMGNAKKTTITMYVKWS